VVLWVEVRGAPGFSNNGRAGLENASYQTVGMRATLAVMVAGLWWKMQKYQGINTTDGLG